MSLESKNLAQNQANRFNERESREFTAIIACVDQYLMKYSGSSHLTLGADIVGTNERIIEAVESYYREQHPVECITFGHGRALRFFQ